MAIVRGFNTVKAKGYLLRLPLFTRAIVFIIFFLSLLSLPGFWDVQAWGSLVPSKVSLFAAHRINTFPLIHLNLLHAIVNIFALTPLMERFENEYGTLTSLALFFGPLTTVPAVLYLVIESAILQLNNAIMGASIWVFLLLGMEAIRTYRSNPHLIIGTHHIPTWTTPLLLAFVVAALVPSSSLLGHICGLGVGYIAGLGYVKYIAPPEWVLRWLEVKLNLLATLPHYVSVDQKTYGRFGVLPSTTRMGGSPATELVGSTQRLGP
ncbi:Peptidase S54, rhomboid [Cordyceps militaris CM01]|uniref:rhomboid protease n=1 Tax=Cordyceps militaris (strain CM01) TaxID=983644 RepID=G3J3R4_CORMM|nr:Peptidase S54, rhomboid [Cordyceps militaris CM01]EGX96539.1 Peptidase S54, rhomboid [Cordyceps militaris CM01]